MVTWAFRDWDEAGRPWKPCRPVVDVQVWARRAGVRVLGTIGNDAHLRSDHPKDHTPFSSTQWPDLVPAPIVFAIDLEDVRRGGVTLGEAIEAQMRAGRLSWIKYLNHGGRHIDSRDLDGDGVRFEVERSADAHVHLSVRTDWWQSRIGVFDPWGTGDGVMPTVDEILNEARIPVTENVSHRISGVEAGDPVSLGRLVEEALVFAYNAQVAAEAGVKRLLGVEARVADLDRVTEARLAHISGGIDVLLNARPPEPGDPSL